LVIRRAIFGLLFTGALVAQTLPVPKGAIVPSIQAIGQPDTYALYLPSSYTPDRKWPIIYAFDPFADGKAPLAFMKDAAERYGYILVGSNVSRNGPIKVSVDAAKVMWEDTHSRLSIDPARRYVTGLSGGARASTLVAELCNGCVAAVIGQGAGFPPNMPPTKESVKFAYFGTAGLLDFNYVEMVQLDHTLENLNVPHRVRYFDGGHQWAPAELWEEILPWLELHAMRAGARPNDQALINTQLAAETKRLQEVESRKDQYALYKELRYAVSDFRGLSDVSAWQDRADALAEQKAVKDGPKREQESFAKQAALAHEGYRDLNLILDNPAESTEPRMRLRQNFGSMRDRLLDARKKGKENDPEILVVRRTLSQVLAQAIEMGQQATRDKDYSSALLLYDLVVDLARYPGWAHYHKALTYSLMGRKKDVLPELKKAVETGMDPKGFGDIAEFAEFRENPEFKKIQQMTPPELPKR
jgi:hypothetical protein